MTDTVTTSPPVSRATAVPKADLALLVLRVITGVVMAFHGYQKLEGGVPGFAGFVESLGIPSPLAVAYIVTYLELLGGIALILGLLARWAGGLIALEMVGTTLLVKMDVGLIAAQGGGTGAELDLMILGAGFTIFLLGAGRWSLDHAFGARRANRR